MCRRKMVMLGSAALVGFTLLVGELALGALPAQVQRLPQPVVQMVSGLSFIASEPSVVEAAPPQQQAQKKRRGPPRCGCGG